MFLKSRPSSEFSEHSLFSIENIYLPDLNLSSSKANGAEFALLGRNYLPKSNAIRTTVLYREMGTGQMGTILRFASVPLRKMGTDLLGSWWPCQCVLPTLYCIESRPNLELASGNCES